MKKLLIVESPAKIKTISKFLGKDFKIMATMGHVKDLPIRELGVTMNDTIELDYVPIENKDKTLADICKEGSKSDVIYLAPDPDREGEIIAWHVEQELEKVQNPNNIYRITFNEITKNAVIEALENPSKINLQKVAAQQARRVLDRWVGYEVSPILWRKISKGLSAGRVQSVALRLICDREKEIQVFKPEEYWSIEGTFKDQQSGVIVAPLTHINKKPIDIKTKENADTVIADLKKTSFIIESIQDKQRLKNPYPPFMTSTLQQAAYNQLGFSVKKTMEIAQKLYEGIPLSDDTPVALITYMRTDSLRIADSALNQVRQFIGKEFSDKYLPKSAFEYTKKGKMQDAHEAIRPVGIDISPDYVKKYISSDAAKLYELIWKRFVACQMKPAEYAQRQVTIQGGEYTFRVTGSTLIFDGFLKVYREEEEEEQKEAKVVLPAHIKEKAQLNLTKIAPKQHFTQPPPRYTEASLVKALEKEGIGRPSTYATILNTIRARSYTQLDSKKRFIPTELGMSVTNILTENLPKIMNIKFTAHMEEDLDKIAKGELERDTLLREFYKDFEKDLEAFRGKKGKLAEPTEIICPKCKKHNLVIRFGKTGEFLGCLGFPECTFSSNFKRDEQGAIELIEVKAPVFLEEACPNCGKPLRQVTGKFGTFIACSGYPECKYIQQEKAGYSCPACKKGEIVRRTWKKGTFWSCNKYPECKFAVFADIIKEPCPTCKNPFLAQKSAGKDKILIFCPIKECGYQREEASS